MQQPRDDWEKPRSHGQHLTEEEIRFLKTSYRAGHTARDAARALKMSSRGANKYWAIFKNEGAVKGINANPPAPTVVPDRFYKPSFEL